VANGKDPFALPVKLGLQEFGFTLVMISSCSQAAKNSASGKIQAATSSKGTVVSNPLNRF
jgi:hypothetical protein